MLWYQSYWLSPTSNKSNFFSSLSLLAQCCCHHGSQSSPVHTSSSIPTTDVTVLVQQTVVAYPTYQWQIISFNVTAYVLLKLTTSKYLSWSFLQFSILTSYNLFVFANSTQPCLEHTITVDGVITNLECYYRFPISNLDSLYCNHSNVSRCLVHPCQHIW